MEISEIYVFLQVKNLDPAEWAFITSRRSLCGLEVWLVKSFYWFD